MEIKEKLLAELNNRKNKHQEELIDLYDARFDFSKSEFSKAQKYLSVGSKLQAINEIIAFVEGL